MGFYDVEAMRINGQPDKGHKQNETVRERNSLNAHLMAKKSIICHFILLALSSQ